MNQQSMTSEEFRSFLEGLSQDDLNLVGLLMDLVKVCSDRPGLAQALGAALIESAPDA